MSEQSLKDKTVKGVGWSAIDNVVQYGITFIVSIVLARLLTPDDYGLLGIIVIFTAVCTALITGGFANALIRKKDATDEDFNTVFVTNLVVSVILYWVIFLVAPFIAYFFGRQELISLTRITSLGLIIGALALVQQVKLTKRIDFKSQTKITFIASVFSGVVGILMALLGFGVWALVFQHLSSQSLRTILLWYVNKWVPQLKFSINSFKDLFGFGWKLMVSSLLNTVWKELYQVVVGRFYSPATLGQYTRSKQFSTLFSSNLTTVIQRVTYPVLSSIQDDSEKLLNAYRRIIKTTMFVTSICMFFLGAISEPLLYCLIGAKWHEAALYLPLICIAGSFYPLDALNLNMLQVKGRSDLFLGLEIIKKIVALAPLFVGAFVGIMPMLFTNLIAAFICYYLNSFYSGRLVGYSTWMQVKDLAPSYGKAILIAISVFPLKYLPLSNWIILPAQLATGILVFFIIIKIFTPVEFHEIRCMLDTYFVKFKKK